MSQAFAAVKAGEESLLCRSYSRYPLAIVRGKGARLWRAWTARNMSICWRALP